MADLSTLLAAVQDARRITEADVRAARAAIYADMTIEPSEAERLFAIDEAASDGRDPAWIALFGEALVDFLVRQEHPQGYVDEGKARWLIARIAADGAVKTDTELEAAVKVLEAAERAPDLLSAFVLDQVRRRVLAAGGRIADADVALLRRALYAFGGQGAAAITRAEAEVLFDINDAVTEESPAWVDLFAKALANLLMAASGYQAPPRAAALARAEWLEAESGGPADFLSRMARSGFGGVLEAYRQPGLDADWEARLAIEAGAIREAEAVTPAEAEWLADRIRRDGAIGEAERALLRFIAEQSPSVHPALKPLIEQAA